MVFNEDFLHYIWQYGLFEMSDLKTSDGKLLSIVKPGMYNTDSGPDFFNARLIINHTEWAGNVEIHKKSSDWQKHFHQNDDAYKNVILHVVYENDLDKQTNSQNLPTLELKNLISPEILSKYELIQSSKEKIPCSSLFHRVDSDKVKFWLERLVVERLERKVEDIGALQKRYANDWEQTFFNRLCRGFGFNINSEPFEHFANILDVRLLMKYSYNLKQTEALLFGVSGLLSATSEIDYYNELQKEFNHLKAAHKLSTMNPAAWKFSKTRPGNFPTLRLAQIAALYHKHQKLFSKILVVNEVEDMHKILKMDVSEFWKSHYTFNKKSPRENISLGNSSVDLLIINTIIPMMFAYSVSTGNEERKEKAVEMLYKLSPENNQITRIYEDLGLKNENSAHSQALLQLYKNYCKQKKCLFCSIGKDLLK